MSGWLNRHFGWAIFTAYAVCELFLLWQGRGCGLFPMPLDGMDQKTMLLAGLHLAQGGMPEAGYMYSPAYTLLLAVLAALTGGSLIAMRVALGVIAACVPVMIERTARMCGLGRNAGRLGALLWLFYGPGLLIGIDFLRAAPLALVFLGMVYACAVSWRKSSCAWACGAGILGGIAILGRENFLAVVVIPLLMLAWPGIRRRVSWRIGGGFVAGLLAAVLPVVVFNGFYYGYFAIVPGHVANVLGAYHGESAVADGGRAFSAIVAGMPRQIFNFFASYEIPNSLSFYAHRELLPFLWIFAVPFQLLAALALAGWWLGRRQCGVWFSALLTAGYAASMVSFEFFYRFRIPVAGLVCMLAGYGVYRIALEVRRHHWRTAVPLMVFVLIWSVCFYQSPDPLRPASERRASISLLIQLARLEEAERLLGKLAADHVEHRDLALRLARAHWRAGDKARAAAILKKYKVI